jgi:hypothetical protein
MTGLEIYWILALMAERLERLELPVVVQAMEHLELRVSTERQGLSDQQDQQARQDQRVLPVRMGPRE